MQSDISQSAAQLSNQPPPLQAVSNSAVKITNKEKQKEIKKLAQKTQVIKTKTPKIETKKAKQLRIHELHT